MKILLTGATGYIGKRLLPVLVGKGHRVVCAVRDKNKFNPEKSIKEQVEIIENDLMHEETLHTIPSDIEIAFYLVHSMSATTNYHELEEKSAMNFRNAMARTHVKQVIYLSGIVNADTLSEHLNSRKNVEIVLGKGTYALTTIRAGIIIGDGSASFEIIRDLVEKLPVMIAPKWINTRSQPIGISDVIKVLSRVIGMESTYKQSFDIAGSEILSYKEMMLGFARERRLKRYIFTVPVMTPKLSSYWLYFITATSYKLASALVHSMTVEVVANEQTLLQMLKIQPLSYAEAIRKAFEQIEQNEIVSSWKDSTVSGRIDYQITDFINVPKYGCFTDARSRKPFDRDICIEKIWRIGGANGWYYANFLWRFRGFLDKVVGGVGIRGGRTNKNKIQAGDALDFWRVIYANKQEGRLLLYAEMKLPGEAWLEFVVKTDVLEQKATFRPKGLFGRLYWYAAWPFHALIFRGMLRALTK